MPRTKTKQTEQTETEATAQIAALNRRVLGIIGWTYVPIHGGGHGRWSWESPDGEWDYYSEPQYVSDIHFLDSMLAWLNSRGYMVVLKQLPTGDAYRLDDEGQFRTRFASPAT